MHLKNMLLCGMAATSFIAANASAQTANAPTAAPAPADVTQLQDIVVTAQRRSEKLSDVPVSVTAFGQRELERAQITDVRALSAATPAVTFTSTPYGSNDLILAIRGVAPGGVLPNVDPAVGVYVDGIYYARPEGSNFALVDMARAEVLRGPQGTLFGRNTIGGALNLTTNEPVYNYEGSIKAGYGNYNSVAATGVLNIPIIQDKLAARLVFSHVNHDGYGYDTVTQSHVADQNDNYGRISLRYDPTPTLRADLVADYFEGHEHQPLWILNYYAPGVGPASVAPYLQSRGSRTSLADYNPLNTSRTYDVTGTIAKDFGWATLKSITGYRNIDFNGAGDLDGTPLPLSDVREFLLKGDQISEELQLAGKSADNRLTWVTGAYYFHESLTNVADTQASATILDNILEPKNTSSSVFAQATYEILPKVRLTGGVRYVHDEREMTYVSPRTDASGVQLPLPAGCATVQAGVNQVPGQCVYSPAGINFNYVPWTAGLDYKPDANTLIYGKVSQGYRSGGFQQAGGTTAAYYKPFGAENVLSEEIGTKLQLLDRRLFINADIYHSNYDDIQQNNVLPIQGSVVIAVLNAGKATINGGELEVTALIDRLKLSGSLGIVDPKFTSGPYAGTVVPTVAKTTWTISAEYPLDLAIGVLTLHADYDYMSSVTFLNTRNLSTGQLYSPGAIASVTQPGYGVVNALASLALKDRDITLAVWGKNLGDTYYAGRSGSYYGSGFNSIVVGDPRTFGFTVAYAFR
jgi:iron complex outermembrane receptor protein